MRPDFGMFERPRPTAALFIFSANDTPRFGEKQLLMKLMRLHSVSASPSRLLATNAVATDGLRFSITPKRSASTEPLLLTFLAINQLTTMAAPFTGALFELPTVNSPKMSVFGPDSDARALVSNRLVLPL